MVLRLRGPFPGSIQLIGVDGGATEVKAREVVLAADAGGVALRATEHAAADTHVRVPSFRTPAERGLSHADELGVVDPLEREQGDAWIEATARCIVRIARERAASQVLLGVAMPGAKTVDGRGIAFALNGPRIIDFAEQLERRLVSNGVELLAPIERLESDGSCCGFGEEHATEGLFRDVLHAYCVAGGTGVAEALKLNGRVIDTDQFESHVPRAWRIRERSGASYDQLVSIAGLNADYVQRQPSSTSRTFPESAVQTDPYARAAFALLGAHLATLIALRMERLAVATTRDSREGGPIVLERIVIGQRLGELLADPRTRPWFHASLSTELTRLVAAHETLARLYGRDVTRRIVSSSLRAAPAIGAAATALIAWDRAHG